jgi:hypothetical protein
MIRHKSRALGGQTIRRSVDAICDPHCTCGEDEKRGLLGLGLKTSGNDLVIWVAKSPRWFLSLSLKTKGRRFVDLRLKTDEQMKTV